MDAKNQQDRAKMVEEAVGRVPPERISQKKFTKFRKQGTTLNLRRQVFCTI